MTSLLNDSGLLVGVFVCLFFSVGAAASIVALIMTHQSAIHAPSWGTVKPTLANFGIWAGTCGGLLTIIDWLTSALKKNRIKEITVSVWIWLAEQEAGKFTTILLSKRAQHTFALITHAIIALLIVALLGKNLGFFRRANVTLELGHPRIDPFQIWVDVFAITLSSWLFGWKL